MPFYLSIGMTTDEYWFASPLLAKAYREANKLVLRRANENAWVQGAYIFNAVSVALANGFGGKTRRAKKYMEKPFDLGLETEIEKAQKVKTEREKIIANLTQWKTAWDRQHKSGEKS